MLKRIIIIITGIVVLSVGAYLTSNEYSYHRGSPPIYIKCPNDPPYNGRYNEPRFHFDTKTNKSFSYWVVVDNNGAKCVLNAGVQPNWYAKHRKTVFGVTATVTILASFALGLWRINYNVKKLAHTRE